MTVLLAVLLQPNCSMPNQTDYYSLSIEENSPTSSVFLNAQNKLRISTSLIASSSSKLKDENVLFTWNEHFHRQPTKNTHYHAMVNPIINQTKFNKH